jgi:hypothetical protein
VIESISREEIVATLRTRWSHLDRGDSREPRRSVRNQALGLAIPCIVSQLTKALNQPVLVVSFGYMPKP